MRTPRRARAASGRGSLAEQMLLPIPQQAAQAAAALALGALLAALYDFFKAFRLRARRGCLTAAADTLFSAALLASLFAFAQGPGEGRLRLFMLAAAALGWALWRCTLSPYALRAFSRAFSALFRALSPLKKIQLRKKIDDTRRTRHDLRQHLRVLDTFLAQGDTEQARRYLQEYTHSNETALHQALQFCPNLTADSVLSYYHGLIVQEKAGFAFHGTIPELEEIQDVDLSAMLGNLLENALEAVRSQKQGERFVHLHADMVSNKLVLHMENSFSGQIHQKGQQFYSSKHSGMGIGTESISMIARKYGGFADFSVENGVFHSRIFIPIPSAKTSDSMKKASHS